MHGTIHFDDGTAMNAVPTHATLKLLQRDEVRSDSGAQVVRDNGARIPLGLSVVSTPTLLSRDTRDSRKRLHSKSRRHTHTGG